MELHALGLNYSHDGSFDIRRPNGSGDNLLLIFKSSAVVRLHGREYSVSPDSAILYKKGTEYGEKLESFDLKRFNKNIIDEMLDYLRRRLLHELKKGFSDVDCFDWDILML